MQLKLPMTLVLNEKGFSLVTTGKLRGRLPLNGNRVTLQECPAQLLTKFNTTDCLKRIEVSLEDIVSHRRDILELSKLLTFSEINKQFSDDVLHYTTEMNLVKSWNRRNPHNQINLSSPRFLSRINQRLKDKGRAQEMYKIHLVSRLWKDPRSSALKDEKIQRLEQARSMLAALHPLTLFILLEYPGVQEVRQLDGYIIERLQHYMGYADIPEYKALLLLEFLQSSERQKLVGLYKRLLDMKRLNPDSYPLNDQIRIELIKSKILVETRFSFVFETKKRANGSRIYFIRTMIHSGNKESENLNKALFLRNNSMLDHSSVYEYFEQNSSNDVEGSAQHEILYYYIKNLQEASKKAGCSFESYVSYVKDDGIVHMLMGFV